MNRFPKRFALAALAASIAAPAVADDGMSYTWVETAWVDTEIDASGFDVDGDGFVIAGSVALNDTFFLAADVGRQDFDQGVDLDQWSIAVGAHTPLSDTIDLVGKIGFVDASIDSRFGSFDDDGYLLSAGLRGRVTDQIELEGGISHVDLDDSGDNTSFDVGGRYYLTPQFALGAGVSLDDDATTWRLGARFEF